MYGVGNKNKIRSVRDYCGGRKKKKKKSPNDLPAASNNILNVRSNTVFIVRMLYTHIAHGTRRRRRCRSCGGNAPTRTLIHGGVRERFETRKPAIRKYLTSRGKKKTVFYSPIGWRFIFSVCKRRPFCCPHTIETEIRAEH